MKRDIDKVCSTQKCILERVVFKLDSEKWAELGKAVKETAFFEGERVMEQVHIKKHHFIQTAYKKVYM